MQDESAILELAASDMAELTVNDIVCVDCIEGFCPARTPSQCSPATRTGRASSFTSSVPASPPFLEQPCPPTPLQRPSSAGGLQLGHMTVYASFEGA